MDDFKVLIEAVLDKAKLGKEFKDIQKFFNSQNVMIKPIIDRKMFQKDLVKISKDMDKIFKKRELNLAAKNVLNSIKTSPQDRKIDSKRYSNTSQIKLGVSNSNLQLNRLNEAIKLIQSQTEKFNKQWKSLKKNPELMAELDQIVTALNALSTETKLNQLNKQLGNFQTEVHAADRATESWSDTLKGTFSEIADFLKLNIFEKFVFQLTENSIGELKKIDDILTDISVSTPKTKDSLESLGISAVNNASKYGTSPSTYLNSVQEMSQAGFHDTRSEKLAELSAIAQSAGAMTAELADSYLIASDAAYGYHGNLQKLNALLDSQNQVANRNAVSFSELAAGTKAAASQLVQMGIDEKELTALLSVGISTSNKSGEAVGNAINGIVMNLQQITGKTAVGQIIDETSLKKAETRCRSLGIELKNMKNGIIELRDPIVLLNELADIYNSLPKGSKDRASIVSDIGGEYGSDVLSSILENWDSYSKMFSDYNNSEGSALEDAMTTANSWGGLLQQIAFNWTGFVQTFVTDDSVTGILKTINGIAIAIKELSNAFGAIPTLAAGIGIFASLKNVGRDRMFSLNYCFLI
ncbi:phage tail tape measure protein [Clostridium sp. MCC353]|uniref:phage tail tape measure protein n=1 Tax=Clostridium sp. MCC353 TaxID=2592646 RepID=UPI001C028469|nr:phage tail tape measure protein [Clostridium sp. MCC353]